MPEQRRRRRGGPSLFKKLAPRMMRDLMRDFSPLSVVQAAGAVGNGGGGNKRLHGNPGKKSNGEGFERRTRVLSMDRDGHSATARAPPGLRELAKRDGQKTRQLRRQL